MNHYIKIDEQNKITNYILCSPEDVPEGFIEVSNALPVCEIYDPVTGTSSPEEPDNG